jgi:poly(hydroxyalkanoate) depolymerase family esterase
LPPDAWPEALVSTDPRHGSAESRVGPRAAAWVEGQWSTGTFRTPFVAGQSGMDLSYGLYVPPRLGDTRTDPLPLVVMLHGCGQSAAAFARGTRMNVLADQHRFAVLYPEQSEQRHPHACWHWYDPSSAKGGAEAHAVAALVERMLDEHDFDATRVYVAGLSAGAGLSTTLAFAYPHRFAAVAAHSGVVFGAASSVMSGLDAMRRGTQKNPAGLASAALDGRSHPGMPALLIHGMTDDVVHPVNLTQLETQFLALNGLLDASGRLVDARVEESQDPMAVKRDYFRGGQCVMRTYQVTDLNHAWSGGDDTVPFNAAHGLEASREIWHFFQAQQRLPEPVLLDE